MRLQSFQQYVRWNFEYDVGNEEDSQRQIVLLLLKFEIFGQMEDGCVRDVRSVQEG